MAKVTATDEEFINVGKKEGLEIWRIENFRVVKIKKEEYGTFYTGDSYIILNTKASKNTSFEWNIHYWLGASSTIDESATAAIKTVELDEYLGGKPIQYREVQYHESKLFMSYFSTGIKYLQGGVATGFKDASQLKGEKKLFMIKGKKDVRMVQVPLSANSLNKGDVFILVDGSKVFQWNPPGTNRMERYSAKVYAKKLADEIGGKAIISVIEDDYETNEDFWNSIDGSPKDIKETFTSDNDFELNSLGFDISLYRVSDAQSETPTTSFIANGPLSRSMLNSNDCFIVDCQAHGIYCWIGKKCTKEEKKVCILASKNLMSEKNYPNFIPLSQVIDDGESTEFKAIFSDWNN